MRTDETLNKVNLKKLLGVYINLRAGDLDLSKGGSQQIRCIFPDHEDSTPSFTYYPEDENYHYHCFGCNKHGDIFDLIHELEGISDYGKQVKWASESLKPYLDNPSLIQRQAEEKKIHSSPTNEETEAKKAAQSAAMQTMAKAREAFARRPKEAVEYIKKRGHDYDFCLRKGVGYLPGKLLFQGDGFFIARNINYPAVDKQKYKFSYGTGGGIFNQKYLYNESADVIFVVEGFFDLLAIEQAGFRAIAFTPTYSKYLFELVDSLDEKARKSKLFILSMDNDHPNTGKGEEGTGQEANRELLRGLTKRGVPAIISNIAGTGPSDPKDASETLLKLGEEGLRARLTNIVQEAQSKRAELIKTCQSSEKAIYRDSELTLSDTGNARRFVNMYSHKVKYCAAKRTWYVFDGQRWKDDTLHEVEHMAKEIPRTILREADRHTDEDKKAYLKFARQSESGSHQREILRLASSDPCIAISNTAFDADKYKYNVLNGTIDLKTGELYDHNPKDYISKLVSVDYHPDAQSNVWDDFISEATAGDEEHASYLRRAAGYSLTGDTSEQGLFLVYGKTGTGKSTFTRAMRPILGDYFRAADTSILLQRGNGFVGSHSDEIAVLEGARFVACEEIDEGQKIAAAILKRMTGNVTISCRAIMQSTTSFEPTHKIWLIVNDRPSYDATDDAVTRRIFMMPFDNQVPIEKRDQKLSEKLDDTKVREAILAWCVRGCLEWQEKGLGSSYTAQQYKEDYLKEIDYIGAFMDECLEKKPEFKLLVSEVHEKYTSWATSNGYTELKSPTMSKKLKKKGMGSYSDGRTRYLTGYCFREAQPLSTDTQEVPLFEDLMRKISGDNGKEIQDIIG